MTSSYADEKGVYRNKLGITDAAQLRRFEYDFTAQRSREILEQNAIGYTSHHGLERLRVIHHHLFQDVYDWAGKIRTVRSSKMLDARTVSVFADPESLIERWQALEQKTSAFAKSRKPAFGQKLDALVDIFIEANHIHPFPEGNGRSLQVFMWELAGRQGVELDYAQTNAKEWNRASAVSGTHGELFEDKGQKFLIANEPDPEPIRRIFATMTTASS
jgi:cell filamentation protein